MDKVVEEITYTCPQCGCLNRQQLSGLKVYQPDDIVERTNGNSITLFSLIKKYQSGELVDITQEERAN